MNLQDSPRKRTFDVVNMYEWEGVVGQPARQVGYITYDYLATFDVRQVDSRSIT